MAGSQLPVGNPLAGGRKGAWRQSLQPSISPSYLLIYVAAGLLMAEAGVGVALLSSSSAPAGEGNTGVPNGEHVSFTLRAYMTGFVGVGGAIAGVRDPMITVEWGDFVSLTVIDGEATIHNLHLDGYGLQSRNLVGVNDSVTLSFQATQRGSFAYYCTVPGHRQAGMQGIFIVGAPSGPVIGPEAPLTAARIAHDPTSIPPPIARNYSTTVNVWLEAREVTAEIEPGVSFTYWTYNGTVPGPFFRVRVGDTVVVHFSNDRNSTMNHSVDFHAVTGPGGGAYVTQTPPGGAKNFSFLAMVPGLFVYHCGTPNIPTHIAMGMYGMMLVEPAGGLPRVDHEFYLMEGELYLQWPLHTPGNQLFNGTGLLGSSPTYVVFNGAYDALTGAHALRVNVNDTVRIFFGEAGPNLFSAFHMIGAMFDIVYPWGDLTDPPLHGLQTVAVPPGSTAVTEFQTMYPANYPLVDHSIVNAIDKGAFAILNVSGWANSSIFHAGSAFPAGAVLGTLGSGPCPDLAMASTETSRDPYS